MRYLAMEYYIFHCYNKTATRCNRIFIKMNFFLITCVTVVSSFQRFYREINDPMQFDSNLKKLSDTRYTNDDSKNGNSIEQWFMMRPDMESYNLENFGQIGEIDYADQLSMLVENMMHNHSPKKRSAIRPKTALTSAVLTDAQESKTQQGIVQLASNKCRGLGAFQKRMFARFHGSWEQDKHYV